MFWPSVHLKTMSWFTWHSNNKLSPPEERFFSTMISNFVIFINELDIRLSSFPTILRARAFFHGHPPDGRILINFGSPYTATHKYQYTWDHLKNAIRILWLCKVMSSELRVFSNRISIHYKFLKHNSIFICVFITIFFSTDQTSHILPIPYIRCTVSLRMESTL